MNDIQEDIDSIMELARRDHSQALSAADQLVLDFAADHRAWDTRSYIRAQLGDMIGALEDIEKVIQIIPKEPVGYWKYARILVENFRYKESLPYLTQAIKISEKSNFEYYLTDLLIVRSISYSKLGFFSEALADIARVPSQSTTWLGRVFSKEDVEKLCRPSAHSQ